MEKDLFEILKDRVGCMHISDLSFGRDRDRGMHALTFIRLEEYSLSVLLDAIEYFHGEKPLLTSKDEAIAFLLQKKADVAALFTYDIKFRRKRRCEEIDKQFEKSGYQAFVHSCLCVFSCIAAYHYNQRCGKFLFETADYTYCRIFCG